MKRNSTALAALAMSTALLLGACGSSSTGGGAAPASTANGATSTTSAAGVNPNGPEVNPAGDIPDNQVYVGYAFPDKTFTVSVPEGWSRTVTGGSVVFTDKLNSIQLETVPATSAPTTASIKRDELTAIEALKGYTAGTIENVTRKAGTGVRITYRADSAADAVTGKTIVLDVERYEFFLKGKEVILTLSGPKGADNVDPWRIVTSSLKAA